MKKQFVNPELEIVKLNDSDIIATSGGTGGSTGGGEWGARPMDLEDTDFGDFSFFDE